MSKLLEGKVVIVTGAGRGVGAEIAKLAAREGASVVVNDLGGDERGEGGSLSPAQEVVNAIEAEGGQAIANGSSVATWEGAHALVAAAIERFGRIDAVVNNAGVLRDTIFHKMSEEDWDVAVDVNLKGCFNVARAAAPHFKAQNSGVFLHMTSTSGLVGNIGQVNYGAAKMGVVGLSKCIALDMERFGVRSNCLAPFAFTRLVATIPADTDYNRARLEKVKKMTPDTIAPLAVVLLSDSAADTNAQVFGVRRNELFVFSQPRPVRSVHTAQGWTPASILEHGLPSLRGAYVAIEKSPDVFSWDPI
ncbi:SDR family NAD(P)-dependent oxidoreductase [Pseudomonas brassicacearum]|jgi:NAD(P)-dependent dehydrogenase (short-subunit alcohol dehydrogenase family)|uniref:3-hydroxyacyl-CoA dehydrogenase n=1 Tax=Pseudomonas brassicacearum TaxID=930166 RepID=A0A423JJU3_9PSED|nr:SDR family NAD(P)-dependent oxidoreductase [Pseudomonas brassicacearum]RON37912.1 3-hydroxyacyl-CoA dehydrogenase [Pseudomonas brassicacearum]